MIFSATRRRTGSLLLGHPDDAEAAFADLLEQLVMADALAAFLRLQAREFRFDFRRDGFFPWLSQEGCDADALRSIRSTRARTAGCSIASRVQIRGAFRGGQRRGGVEDFFDGDWRRKFWLWHSHPLMSRARASRIVHMSAWRQAFQHSEVIAPSLFGKWLMRPSA